MGLSAKGTVRCHYALDPSQLGLSTKSGPGKTKHSIVLQMPLVSAPRRLRRVDLWEAEACLVYTVSSEAARAIQ